MTQETPDARAHVLISGRVQGVSFRYYTVQMAQKLHVMGWVRNLANGKVEAVFEGGRDGVDSMISWCRTGPPAANVDDLEIDWETPTGEFSGFNLRF